MAACRRLRSASLLFLAVACVASPMQDSATLRLKFAKDTTLKYHNVTTTNMEMLGQPSTMTITMDQSTKVLAQKDGWTTVTIKTDGMKMDGDSMIDFSQAAESAKGTVITMDVDERGTAKNFKFETAADADPMVGQLFEGTMRTSQAAGFMGVYFPEGAVSVGTKWSAEIDAEKMFGKNETISSAKGKLPLSFEVLAFENVDGKRTARISTKMAGTVTLVFATPAGEFEATMKIESAVTNWVELATGFLMKSEGISKTTGDFAFGSISQDINVKISRLP